MPELEDFNGEDEVPIGLFNGVYCLDDPGSVCVERLFFRGHGHLNSGSIEIDAEIFEQGLLDRESEAGLKIGVEDILWRIRRFSDVSEDE